MRRNCLPHRIPGYAGLRGQRCNGGQRGYSQGGSLVPLNELHWPVAILAQHAEQSDAGNNSSISCHVSEMQSCLLPLELSLVPVTGLWILLLKLGLCFHDLCSDRGLGLRLWTWWVTLRICSVFSDLRIGLIGFYAGFCIGWILGNTIQGWWRLNKDFKPSWCICVWVEPDMGL